MSDAQQDANHGAPITALSRVQRHRHDLTRFARSLGILFFWNATLLCAFALAACNDSTATGAVAGNDSALASPSEPHFYYECVDPSLGCEDPTDTQVSADITFNVVYTATLNDAFLDPVSGQQTNVLTVSPPDLHVHVEAGYLRTGKAKITTSYSDGADASTTQMPQVVRQDLTGNSLTDINPLGYALTNTIPDSMSAAPVMNLVGSTTNGDITAGLLVDMSDTVKADVIASDTNAAIRDSRVTRMSAARAFLVADRGIPTRALFNGADVMIRRPSPGVLTIEDISPASLADAMTPQSTRSDPSPGVQRVRTYRKSATAWVISEDRVVSAAQSKGGQQRTVHVMSYANVHWKRNAVRDAMRRAARPSLAWIPMPPESTEDNSAFASTGGVSADRISVPGKRSNMIACDDQCVGGGGGGTTPPGPLGSAAPCLTDVAWTVNATNASVNILYQHGFASSATTWCKMSEYVRSRFMVGYELRHSLTWRDSYEDQASDLAGRFQNDILGTQTGTPRAGPYVLIGHSNGGVVSRYMAQNLSDPSKVAGVLSVSSPHGGVYLANIGQATLTAALAVPFASAAFGCDVAGAYVCSRTGALTAEVLAVVGPTLFSNVVPVIQEAATTSAFHNTINARGDAAYRVAGVQNQIWDRWTLWRLLGDQQQCVPQPFISCDDVSRRYVNAVDKTYHHYIDCSVITGLFGFFWPPSWSATAGCAKNAATLISIDYVYKRLSVGSGRGDGVVPLWSQMYPGAPSTNQFLVDDADSHVGETKSKRTADQIVRALNVVMLVPIAQ